jgi:uncharacterized membrane protein YhaH (DUF805 family)|tara:strand:- start:59 stop:430 length:372 start_codon:yes stop_codon:yes gene_type:complete
MSFFEAIMICFSKYVTFAGRANRSEFWYCYLFLAVGAIITAIIDIIIFPDWVGAFSPLSTVFSLALLLPFDAVSARRMHDVNRSGWWQLIPLTIIGIIPYTYWVTKKSDPQDNNFGPNHSQIN